MTMTAIDACIQFANENPVTFVSTLDGDQPRVRAFAMWFADKTGFYYHTGTTKEVYRQLSANPKVELCFFSQNPPPAGKMMRVAGKVEFLEDLILKSRLIEERPYLKAIGTGKPDNPLLVLFRVPHGEAHFWTMENNLREREVPRIRF
jgi:pyridoxamine 5'-phosphate oxidase